MQQINPSKYMQASAFPFFFLLFMLFLTACQPSNQRVIQPHSIPFFDVGQYFKAVANKLTEKAPKVSKTIVNGQQEQTQEQNIDNWQQELQLFIDAAIEEDAYHESYTVDTAHYDNQKQLLRMQAIDNDVPTQLIEIEFVDTTLVSLLIVHKISNPIYETQHYLSYFPGSHYQIKKSQKVVFQEMENYEIDVEFNPDE